MKNTTVYYLLISALIVFALAPAIHPCLAQNMLDHGMKITSPAFPDGGMIPRQFALKNRNINPPLFIEGSPPGTQSLALILEDPDAPRGNWVHWIVYDIPVTDRIPADSAPGREGINDFGRMRYDGPSPPSGIHRYIFKLYALDRMLNLPEGASKQQLENAMRGHILEQAQLTGLYRRN